MQSMKQRIRLALNRAISFYNQRGNTLASEEFAAANRMLESLMVQDHFVSEVDRDLIIDLLAEYLRQLTDGQLLSQSRELTLLIEEVTFKLAPLG